MPVSTKPNREQAASQLEQEVDQLIRSGAPETLVRKLVPIWVEGAVAQLVNFPADLCIEREIHAQPALRTVQESSLLEQVSELRRTLSLEVARFTPPTIYRNSLTMNYVLVRQISELLNKKDLLKPLEDSINKRLGKELYYVATEGPDRGYWGDRLVIFLWAQKLNMTDWFEWRNTKEIEHWPDVD